MLPDPTVPLSTIVGLVLMFVNKQIGISLLLIEQVIFIAIGRINYVTDILQIFIYVF